MRQFIPYTERVAIAPASSTPAKPHFCQRCNSPISTSHHKVLCDLCWSMLEAVASPYWHKIQREWWKENDRRVAIKTRLLNPDMEEDDDDYHSA